MRITSPAVTIKDIWDALTADYGAAGTYGLLVETNLDAPVSGAKADLTTLETRLSAARATALDELLAANLPADIAAIPIAPALAASWTAALATALGAYTAAKAAFLDVAISSRLATAAYTAERGTDSAALASAWTAALATILGNFSAARIAKLDNLDGKISEATQWYFVASDTLEKSSDATTTSTSDTYELKKTETYNPTPTYCIAESELRVKFDLEGTSTAGSAFGRIYINGVAVGIEREVVGAGWTTFSEDFPGIAIGDTIELWQKRSSSDTSYAKNFRIYADIKSSFTQPSW